MFSLSCLAAGLRIGESKEGGGVYMCLKKTLISSEGDAMKVKELLIHSLTNLQSPLISSLPYTRCLHVTPATGIKFNSTCVHKKPNRYSNLFSVSAYSPNKERRGFCITTHLLLVQT